MINLKHLWRIILISFFIQNLVSNVNGATKADEVDRIQSRIMTDYKKEVHPSTNREDGAVTVKITVTPLFIDVDEANSVFILHFWFGLSWTDSRLAWDAAQYSNITLIHLAPDRIWKPDMRVFNSIQHEDYEDTDVLLAFTGTAYWIPPVTSRTTCKLDFTYWPWDIQMCDLVIGSWTRHGWDIDVANPNMKNISNIMTKNFVKSNWEIKKAIARRSVRFFSGVSQPWPDIRARFVIKRESAVDKKISLLPLTIVSFFCLASFWTHPMSKTRLALTCLNIVILVLSSFFLRNRLPKGGAQIPMIVSFAGSLTVLVAIQFVLTLVQSSLLRRKDDPPGLLVRPLDGILGRILCVTDVPLIGPVTPIDVEELKNSTIAGTDPEAGPALALRGWTLLSHAIDRIFFILFSFIIAIFLAAYIGGAQIAIDQM